MTFQLSSSATEIYEDVLVPLWFGPWASDLMSLVILQPGERVLDVACGTGVTTRLAQTAVGAEGAVTGLDINADMLAKAEALAAGAPINWMQSDVVETGLPLGTFDAVISQHGYHYFPDSIGALSEFHSLLRPGGRMALSIWAGHSPYTQALCAAVETHISPDVAAKQSSQRETPSEDDLAQDLEQAGFTDIRIVRQTRDITVPNAQTFVPLHLASMPIAAAFTALPPAAQSALITDVAAALAEHTHGDELTYPDAVNVMTARRPD